MIPFSFRQKAGRLGLSVPIPIIAVRDSDNGLRGLMKTVSPNEYISMVMGIPYAKSMANADMDG